MVSPQNQILVLSSLGTVIYLNLLFIMFCSLFLHGFSMPFSSPLLTSPSQYSMEGFTVYSQIISASILIPNSYAVSNSYVTICLLRTFKLCVPANGLFQNCSMCFSFGGLVFLFRFVFILFCFVSVVGFGFCLFVFFN